MGLVAGAVYLLIALGRANLYYTFQQSLAFAAVTSRYHYAGSIPVAVLLALILWQVGRLPALRAIPGWLGAGAGIAFVVAGQLLYPVAIDDHYRCHDYFFYTQQEIARAVAAAPPGATVYIENRESPRHLLGVLDNKLFPGRAAVYVLTHDSATVDGRHVRFVERNPDVLEFVLARPETPLARIMVGPDGVASAVP
jgi:hypothetical protein